MRSPVVSGGATGLHFIMCFLFGRERQNWAFSQLEMGGSGAGSELVMMAAVHLMSLQEKKKEKKGMTDTGLCETPPASSTPVQIHVEKNNIMYVNLFFFIHKNKWQSIYSYFSYCQQSSQWPSTNIDIILLSHKRLLPHAISDFFLEFNSYQKYSLSGYYFFLNKMTAYKHWSLQLRREFTTILIAIKNETHFYKTQVPLNTLQRTISIHCYSIIHH